MATAPPSQSLWPEAGTKNLGSDSRERSNIGALFLAEAQEIADLALLVKKELKTSHLVYFGVTVVSVSLLRGRFLGEISWAL